jgi:hypothetical protein
MEDHIALWIPIVSIVFITMGWVVLVVAFFWWRNRRLQAQTEVQTKLIERFGSTPELVSFLNSQAGRDFVNGVQTGTMYAARNRVISGMQRAIILSVLGLAFIVLLFVMDQRGLAWPGIFLLALGLGFFLATWVSVRMASEP